MKQTDFSRHLASVTPEMPNQFSDHMDHVFEKIVQQEENKIAKEPVFRNKRPSARILIIALLSFVLFCSVALAAIHWGILDSLGFMLGTSSSSSNAQLQKIMHKETVNNVEITILEAGYDGRTLFIQYSYRLPNETEEWGTPLPYDAMEKLNSYHVGWWIDHFWVNGQCMEMAENSGSITEGTQNPGEIMITEYWRLDNLDISLNGEVTIALPIGEHQPLEDYSLIEHPEKYDHNGMLLQPDQGLISFTFDAGEMQQQVTTLHPCVKATTDKVTVKATEASFSPLMTYITLDLKGNPQVLNDYKAEKGEGFCDESGKVIWPYTAADVHHSYITSLTLVDGHGRILFPDHNGCNGCGDDWAEFLFPAISSDEMPDELWLAPTEGNTVLMQDAIRIK